MRIVAFAFAMMLAGCSTIQSYENLVQPVGRQLNTHVGGQVFKIERTSDLPNAFGKADLWGGKVDRGFTEVRYQGLSEGKALFLVTEIETQSNETSMSRYGGSRSSFNAQTYGNTTYGSINTINAPKGSTTMLPPNSTQFSIDLNSRKEFEIAGVVIKIVEATETSLRYQVAKR